MHGCITFFPEKGFKQWSLWVHLLLNHIRQYGLGTLDEMAGQNQGELLGAPDLQTQNDSFSAILASLGQRPSQEGLGEEQGFSN